jgi:hypothetical protein
MSAKRKLYVVYHPDGTPSFDSIHTTEDMAIMRFLFNLLPLCTQPWKELKAEGYRVVCFDEAEEHS